MLAAAVVVAVGVGVWIAGQAGDRGQEVATDDPGLSHVHGLGIDPADGTLYAATHFGVLRVGERGEVRRIGGFQDTMGFTVVGPGHFLASGHPAPNDDTFDLEGRPPLLGLIESTDTGRHWRSRSLLGQADFHALVAAHGRVYGYNASGGRFLVSADGENWDPRAEVALASFAVDPADPDHLIGAGEQGLMVSTDGGRQWEPASGPTLVFLAWDAAAGLWGVGPDSTVAHSADGGASWATRGQLPGQPEALLATGDALYAAVAGQGVFRSDDEGRTWDQLAPSGRP